ncbi:hypothetical protein CIG75_02895 [Tumebacillus algifaecis]|uniref:Uncharacterized protein n=1 Tax=Tumebacillus algifaecis TaxID=1214604 RepID=A0A223CXK9_9BACL|nr:hypothetical protein [Tumebacillus algifaecis]ASS74031.1 hypothetical protein CIG75_02895 [Tumebacillus algifaecis]
MNLFGLIDFYNGLEKCKEIGGCIETESITLADGSQFDNAVIVRVDYTGHRFYSLGFMDEQGAVRVVNVDQLTLVLRPVHKRVADVNNKAYQAWAFAQKSARAKRLLEFSQGAAASSYQKELQTLLNDLGMEETTNLSLKRVPTEKPQPAIKAVG